MQHNRRSFLKSMAALGAAAAWPARGAESGGEWVIGQIAPFSGPQAPLSLQQSAGIQLAFAKANGAGGVGGRALKLVSRDDLYSPVEAPKQFDALLESGPKPVALIGAFGTENTEALIKSPNFQRSGLPLVGGRTGASVLRAPNRQVFHLRAGYRDEVEKIVEHLTANGVKEIGMVYMTGALGQDCLEGLKASLQKRGLKPARTAEIDLNATRVATTVKTMLEATPQAVILGTSSPPAIAFLREFRKAGGVTQSVGLSTIDTDLLVSTLGDGARGIMLTEVIPDQVQKQLLFTRDFLADIKQYGAGKVPPSFAAAEGYLVGRVFTEALRRASPNPTPARITDALEAMNNYDVGGVPIAFSQTEHVGTRYVDTAVVSSGGRLQY
jgi:ABC-type branched-subunit amino acid transport system substrate-binding protein